MVASRLTSRNIWLNFETRLAWTIIAVLDGSTCSVVQKKYFKHKIKKDVVKLSVDKYLSNTKMMKCKTIKKIVYERQRSAITTTLQPPVMGKANAIV